MVREVFIDFFIEVVEEAVDDFADEVTCAGEHHDGNHYEENLE